MYPCIHSGFEKKSLAMMMFFFEATMVGGWWVQKILSLRCDQHGAVPRYLAVEQKTLEHMDSLYTPLRIQGRLYIYLHEWLIFMVFM